MLIQRPLWYAEVSDVEHALRKWIKAPSCCRHADKRRILVHGKVLEYRQPHLREN